MTKRISRTLHADNLTRFRHSMYQGLIRAARSNNMTLPEYCAEWWKEDWKAAANVFAKIMPKDINVQKDVNVNLNNDTKSLNFISNVLANQITKAIDNQTVIEAEPITEPIDPVPVNLSQYVGLNPELTVEYIEPHNDRPIDSPLQSNEPGQCIEPGKSE